MPWYFPWSDSIKKRASRYLLQRYIGHFLKEKLTLDQLSVDIYNGTGSIQDVLLDVESLNSALDNNNVPVEIVDGFIGSISVTIPWSALVSDSSMVEVHNLELTIQPKQRTDSAGVMLDSMFHSMTTSLQLAQECLKQEPSEGEQQADTATPFEGLEMFAQTIEAVLTRIKLTFIDTIVRLEHLPKESKTGAALEVRINRIEYFDDVATETKSSADKSQTYEPAAISHKNFHFMGVSVFCDEFPECHRTFSRTSSNSPPHSPRNGSTEPSSPSFSPPKSLRAGIEGLRESSPPSSGTSSPRESQPIKIAVLLGKQEVKLKVKQAEEIPGPKLEFDCHLGGINMHVSPHQVHLMLEIAKGLYSPGLCDDSNVQPKKGTSKPMMPGDYERVEHELQKQLQHVRLEHTQPLMRNPWRDDDDLTTQPLDDSDDEAYFDLVHSQAGMASMESSFSSTITNKSASTVASGFIKPAPGMARREPSPAMPKTSKTKSPKQKDVLHKYLDDPSAELTRYRLKLSFLSVTVLHEDPAATPSDAMDPGQSSTEKLKTMAEQFFGRAAGINVSGYGTDLVALREQFTQACPYDHLGLLGKPVSVEVNQKTSSMVYSIQVDLSVGLAELVECVFDRRHGTASILGFSLPIDNILPDVCPLLTFVEDESQQKKTRAGMFSSLHTATPNIKLKVTHADRTYSSTRRHSSSALPKTEVTFELGACESEIDMTIVDRIQSLLNPQPLAHRASTSSAAYRPYQAMAHTYFSQAMDEMSSPSDSRLNLRISSPHAKLFVRFPIPDLRTGTGIDKLPWWRRSLRSEILILELCDLDFQTVFDASEPMSKYELTCRDAHVMFQDSGHAEPVSLGRVSAEHGQERGFDWPRVVILVYPEKATLLEEEEEEGDESLPGLDPLNGACNFSQPQPSPFCTRKVMFENEELVMPGDRQEMNQFQEKATSNTRLHIDISLPSVNVLLPSKDLFELIYNRINNDLLLWEPLAPAPLAPPEYMLGNQPWSLDLATQLMQQQQQQQQEQHLDQSTGASKVERFLMCKSGVQYDSSSDSEEESGQFYSIHEQKLRQRRKQQQEEHHRQSKMCVSLTITRGKLTMCAPLRNEDGKVEEDHHGHFVLMVQDATVFSTVHYNGDPELRYVCVQSNKATVFHRGDMTEQPSWDVLDRTPVTECGNQVWPAMYLSEPGVYSKLNGQVGCGSDSHDQLSVAIKIHLDTFRNVKQFQIALGVRGTTLRHRTTHSNLHWFTQLLDMFDVVDQPILGYTMPKVVTELHTHLWSCAVDYRPINLPYRAMLTAETFSVSSNIIAESPTSLLRFIVEDAALYMSDRTKATTVDLKKNYVCVMDLGIFELSMRTSDGKDPKYAKMDLRASDNILHIRTCSDSCRALADLIRYMADYGDLAADENHSDTKSQASSKADEASVASGSPQMSQSHMEQVHDMMADAMKESSSDNDSPDNIDSPGAGLGATEVFFFPDDKQDNTHHPTPLTHITVAMTSDSITSSGSLYEEEAETDIGDEEFCIIDDPGLGIAPRDGEPKVRMLTKSPISVIDNHFAMPLGKTDQLKAPEGFPLAVYRYTLREMSLVWHMYGGNDFASSLLSKTGAISYGAQNRIPQTLGKAGWQARGGPGRDIEVLMELQLNKVRMQHEVFPETTEQASRQILLVKDIEVRDRLSLSKINKFLYQYTSESLPRQSHANMLMIKSLHVRPDPAMATQECSLKVSLLPLRLNIDQDAMYFLRTFFTEISGEDTGMESQRRQSAAPVMMVGQASNLPPPDPQELLIMFDEITEPLEEEVDEEDEEEVEKKQPVYFKRFVFSPDVHIRLDYHGKRVDMEQGTLAGLVVGLAQLNCSELKLKAINHRHGLLGFDRLMLFCMNEWLQDIKKNQLPNILGGVGPMYSLVQLVQGIRDLFWLPVEQYRKDGRIVRGIQRGAHSFTTSTAMAALELSNRLVQTVQYAAEITYDMVSPGPSVRQRKRRQPADLREGVANAYKVVSEGIRGTANTIVTVAVSEHEQKGLTGAVGGVLRQVPPTLIQPVLLTTEATSNVLGGMRNQLRPDRKREDEDKWKPEDS